MSTLEDKSDWPWADETPPLPDTLPNGHPWPRISVITPSYNQGQFLETTIRSVLLQNYPNLEYIVIDGGSSDDSPEIIKKYEKYLAYWVSEPDRGQSHAINKGFERATGEILCWLNSDDYFLPGTLRIVAETLAAGTGNFALVGHARLEYKDGRPSIVAQGRYDSYRQLMRFWAGYQMHQPSVFWRREVFEKVGFLDVNQHYIMDFDYWARIGKDFDFTNVDAVLSVCTYHENAKTSDGAKKYFRDLKRNAHKYWGSRFKTLYWCLKFEIIYYYFFRPPLCRLVSFVTRMRDSFRHKARLIVQVILKRA